MSILKSWAINTAYLSLFVVSSTLPMVLAVLYSPNYLTLYLPVLGGVVTAVEFNEKRETKRE